MHRKLEIREFLEIAHTIRDNEVYRICDLPIGNLVASMTILHGKQHTSGHAHDDADEIYLFLEGKGSILLKEQLWDLPWESDGSISDLGSIMSNLYSYPVEKDSIVQIEHGVFHQVTNDLDTDLVFICFFPRYEGHDSRGTNGGES